MRTLNRNKIVFYYALYEGKEPVIDDYGNVTGEYEVKYSRPKKFRANISAANGKADVEQFGANVDYDKVIVGDNIFPQIDEYTIMWIDTVPVIDNEGKTETPHDYIVKKIARSLNSVSIAVSKVEVSR
jgi:hypothetical protein